MALSDAMLARGIVEYLRKNYESFENYLYEQYDLEVRVNFNGEIKDKKRMLIRLETLGQDDLPISEHTYSLKIETPK